MSKHVELAAVVLIRLRMISVACTMCAIAWMARPVHAGSIFDDDWTPPKPAVQQHNTHVPSPPVGPATAPTAGHPAAAPAPATPHSPAAVPSSPQSSRRQIPPRADQARSRSLFKAAFASQLNDHSMAGRRKLATMLLDEAPKDADNPSDEFVVLGGAIEASKDASALDLCFRAADIMSSQYEVDARSIKADAASKIDLRGDSPDAALENVWAAIDLADELLQDEDFATATRMLTLARPVAARNPLLASAIKRRLKTIEALRVTLDSLGSVAEKLKASPDDPDANLAFGSHLCFDEGEWDQGLAMLAKGSDPDLKGLAGREIAQPRTTDATALLADGWWDAAGKKPGANRGEVLLHAASLYQSALEGATGLRRTLMENRIAEAAAGHKSQQSARLGISAELLGLVQVDRDLNKGHCTRDGDVLVISDEAALTIPASPRGDYVIRAKAMRKSGANDIAIHFPVGDTILTLVLSGWYGSASGLDTVDQKGWDKNKTSIKPGRLTNEKWYDISIRVTEYGKDSDICVKLDGQDYIHWTGLASELSSRSGTSEQEKRDKFIILGCAHDAVDAFASVRVIQFADQ
jgi:hypothetical protein